MFFLVVLSDLPKSKGGFDYVNWVWYLSNRLCAFKKKKKQLQNKLLK